MELQKKYRVVGLPTVILLDAKGNEVERLTDFVPPSVFINSLRRVK
jgi:thioredoxin-related protein